MPLSIIVQFRGLIMLVESTQAIINRQITMQQQQLQLRQQLIEQYYRYLTLLKRTNNFQINPDAYQNINFAEYSGKISIIGRITQIINEQNYCFPMITTNLNKKIFQHLENPNFRKILTPIVRKFIVSSNIYKNKLIVPFNKVMSSGKKNKEQLFIFTNLEIILREENDLCFAFTDHSHIAQIQKHFYTDLFKHLENSLVNTYSDLNFASIFPENQLAKESTFVIQQIRNKIHQNINDLVILGVLSQINWASMKKPVNPKQKQALLQITQDSFKYRYNNLGTCRIYVRFDILDEDQLVKHLQQGCVYLFLITQIVLSDTITLNLKINNWKKNFLKITTNPIKKLNPKDFFDSMKISPISLFTNPCIFRNQYKFDVFKYDLKLFHAKIVCEKCQQPIFRSTAHQYICKNSCGSVQGYMKLWVLVGVMDKSCYGQLSIQDNQVLKYFDITQQQSITLKDQIAKQQQDDGKSGLVLYFKKNKDDFNQDDPNQIIGYDRNRFLASIVQRCLVRVVRKTIIGYGKVSTNQNLYAFCQDVKQEALTSFATRKQFLKKAKVFVNGNLRTFQGRGRLIPYIKVEHVLPL